MRLNALMAGVTSALTEHQVTVTGLGRNLKSHSKTITKHDIKPMTLGTVLYSKTTRFPCAGVMVHGMEKGKHKKKKRGGISQDSKSLYYSKKAKQPWLLVSHLPEFLAAPKKVLQLYRYRMQIEEGFRDTTNQQYGIGLAQAKSKSAKRYNNLLLIAALTLFLLWCIGQAAINNKYHYRLQASTTKHKAVLSCVYIAIQIINDKRYKIKKKELKEVLENISEFTKKVV